MTPWPGGHQVTARELIVVEVGGLLVWCDWLVAGCHTELVIYMMTLGTLLTHSLRWLSVLWKVKGDVTCHVGSHSVTCHPTQVNTPRLTPAMQAGTRFTYPGGMEG